MHNMLSGIPRCWASAGMLTDGCLSPDTVDGILLVSSYYQLLAVSAPILLDITISAIYSILPKNAQDYQYYSILLNISTITQYYQYYSILLANMILE